MKDKRIYKKPYNESHKNEQKESSKVSNDSGSDFVSGLVSRIAITDKKLFADWLKEHLITARELEMAKREYFKHKCEMEPLIAKFRENKLNEYTNE